MTAIDESAVKRAIRIGACNIFHGCVHNMLYEKNEDILRELYKSASFVVQAIAFMQTGNYICHQKELLHVVSAGERTVVETFLSLKNGGTVDFDMMSETLWAKLPSHYVGESFVRVIPFKDHINIEAKAISEYKEMLSGYKVTTKGMLQIFLKQELPVDVLKEIFVKTLG